MEKISGLIAICGGIGSGKSVVSKILAILGFPVYDCDSRAKKIMDDDVAIHVRLCSDIHPEAVVGRVVNRQLISQVVFSDPEALKRLNAIVHAAVKADLSQWCAGMKTAGNTIMFVETAILRQSGLIDMVEDAWEVTSPLSLRIERVKKRSGLTERQILARIQAQQTEQTTTRPHQSINNAPTAPLLPQIHVLLKNDPDTRPDCR